MFILKAAYCRIFQKAFKIAIPFLPYREPKILSSCTELGKEAENKGIKSVLLVTDSGVFECGLTASVESGLNECGIKTFVYSKTRPNPTVENVEEALNIYKSCGCDALVAVGGGSSIDCAKAVGARVAYPNKTLEQMKGILKVLRPLPPIFAVPTTAGTGSETTLASVITDDKKHHKYALMSFPLIPHYAVLDPALCFSLPPQLTATTGMDALTHAVEAYIGGSATKETKAQALEAAKLVFDNIETAFKDGNNKKARQNMLFAAYKAGLAFSKSYVGYIHALAHSLGGMYQTPHGLANAVIMPYVLEAYGKKAHKKLFEMSVFVGISKKNESPEQGAKKFICAVKELNRKMGIPQKISGIKKEDIKNMAKKAEREANPLYPVPKLFTQKELEQFYYNFAERSDDNEQ